MCCLGGETFLNQYPSLPTTPPPPPPQHNPKITYMRTLSPLLLRSNTGGRQYALHQGSYPLIFCGATNPPPVYCIVNFRLIDPPPPPHPTTSYTATPVLHGGGKAAPLPLNSPVPPPPLTRLDALTYSPPHLIPGGSVATHGGLLCIQHLNLIWNSFRERCY